jgi:hypothetical protein
VSFGKERFAGIAQDYFSVWAKEDGNSDKFAHCLEVIRGLVIDEVRRLWNSEWHSEWFERACLPKLHKELPGQSRSGRRMPGIWRSSTSRERVLRYEIWN